MKEVLFIQISIAKKLLSILTYDTWVSAVKQIFNFKKLHCTLNFTMMRDIVFFEILA
jgi:hypothetical protein